MAEDITSEESTNKDKINLSKKSEFKLYGILGNPVEHSLSPLIHNTWFKQYEINAYYQYIPVNNPNNLPRALQALHRLGYHGINITVPYKEDVYLATLPENRHCKVPSANTLTLLGDGEFKCHNTDIDGFNIGIEQEFGKENLEGKSFLVLGAGGAAHGVIEAIKSFNPNMVYIHNRTFEKAQAFEKKYQNVSSIRNIKFIDFEIIDVIVNTTSVGLHGEEVGIDYSGITDKHIVVDIVYNRNKKTPFLKKASKQGAKTQNGISMLVGQAAKSFEIWTGIMPDCKLAIEKVSSVIDDQQAE